MKNEDIIQIGNKVDMCSIFQKEKNEASNEKTPILSSRIESVSENGELTLEMPIYRGKLMLLATGSRYEMLFYTRKGLYSGIYEVIERFKKDDFYYINVESVDQIKKVQRRKYFRLECILGVLLYEITSDQALLSNGEPLSSVIASEDIRKTEKQSVVVDISGGGVRFIGDKEYALDSYLAIVLILESETIHQRLTVPIRVVSCRKTSASFVRYETRAKFAQLSEPTRDTIIKFIFEEDRKIRRKETGI